MKKVLWKSLELALAVGETTNDAEIALEKGERIVAAVSTPNQPNEVVNLGLYENGNEISAPMALPFWERSNSGQYLDGFKPIEYKGGSTVTVRLTSKEAVSGTDVKTQIVFGIIKTETSC